MSTRLCLAAALTVAAALPLCGQTGNGAPSGAHFNLNIIGVPHNKSPNMKGSGNVIFVGLGTSDTTVSAKILLSQSADGVFQVLDKNGTDGEASFALPVPGTYTVWARTLGTPGDSRRSPPARPSAIPLRARRASSARPTTRSSC